MMKKICSLLVVLIIVFPMFSCSSKRIIEGYVMDAFQKKPLSGKKVWVEGVEYITNIQGYFETQPLSQESVKVEIEGDEHFEPFSDQLILYDKINLRKFEVWARHPLGLPHEKGYLPYSYRILLESGETDNYDKVHIEISAVPSDQSYESMGQYYDSQNHVMVTHHMIQLGFNFWFRDEYQNWQFSTIPPIDLPTWGMMVDALVNVMYEFYYNLDYRYELAPEDEMLNDEKVRAILIHPLKSSNLFEEMTVYMANEGKDQGALRLALIQIGDHSWLKPKIRISFRELNTDLQLMPPEITH